MFGGLTLTDLCIGVIAMSSAIIVVCAVAVFTACHALLFIAIPLGQLIIGIGLLTNPYDLKVVQSSVPYLSQVLLLDRELIAVIGTIMFDSFGQFRYSCIKFLPYSCIIILIRYIYDEACSFFIIHVK